MSDNSAELLYNKAINYYEEAKYNLAIENFKKALEIKPDYWQAYYNLGNTYFKKKEYAAALENYKQSVKINPEDIQAYQNMGMIYSRDREYELAIDCYKKAVEINKKDVDAYNELGLLYSKIKKFDEALESLNKALEIIPNYLPVKESINIVMEMKNAEEKEQAAIEMKKVCNEDKEEEYNYITAELYYNIALSRIKEKKLDLAMDYVRKSLKIKPHYQSAYELLNKLLPILSASQGAQNTEDALALIKTGISFISENKNPLAIGSFLLASQLEPANPEIYMNLGLVYFKEKKFELALENFKKCSELNPENSKAKELIYKVIQVINANK